MGVRTASSIRIQRRGVKAAERASAAFAKVTIEEKRLGHVRDRYIEWLVPKLRSNIKSYNQPSVTYAPPFDDFHGYAQRCYDNFRIFATKYPMLVKHHDGTRDIYTADAYSVKLPGPGGQYLHLLVRYQVNDAGEQLLNFEEDAPLLFVMNTEKSVRDMDRYSNNELELTMGERTHGEPRPMLRLKVAGLEDQRHRKMLIERSDRVMELIKILTSEQDHEEKDIRAYWRNLRI